MPAPAERVPFPTGLHRSAYLDHDEWMRSARFSSELLASTVGRPELAGVDVLDVGCGTKVTKALLDDDWPVGSYVGVDVAADVIDWLRAHVDDPRFEYHHLAARNELYNPDAPPLAEIDALPVGDRTFDLICLFSVFTHLDPTDYVAMLRLLRPHIRPDGHLLFSLFVTDPANQVAAMLERALASPDPAVVQKATERIAAGMTDPPFVDEVPEQPLLRARYANQYALDLVAGTGWRVQSLDPPGPYIQNTMVCRPI